MDCVDFSTLVNYTASAISLLWRPFACAPYETIVFVLFLVAFIFLGKHISWKRKKGKPLEESKDFIGIDGIDLSTTKDPSIHFWQLGPIAAVTALSLAVAELLNILCILFLGWPENYLAQTENIIAVAVASCAILFPVILLVISHTEKKDAVSTLKSHALLAHSYSLLCGVLLLSFMGRFIFPLHPFAGRTLAFVSIVISAIVFYRLIRATLSPQITRKIEDILIKNQVAETMKRSFEIRVGFNKTYDFFKDNEEINYNRFYRKEEYSMLMSVEAAKRGTIKRINAKALNSLFKKVKTRLPEMTIFGPSKNIEPQGYRGKEKNLVFDIKRPVGEGVDIGRVLLEVYVPNPHVNQARREDVEAYEEGFRKCFVVEEEPDQALTAIDQFEDVCEEVKSLSLKSIDQNELDHGGVLERYLGLWLEASAEAFQELNIKYNLDTSKGEVGILGDWTPLKKALEILGEAGIRSLALGKFKQTEYLTGLTSSLFAQMARKGEILSCYKLLQLNLMFYAQLLKKNDNDGLRLAGGIYRDIEVFLRHYLTLQIEENLYRDADNTAAIELAKCIFYFIQEYLRVSLDCNRFDIYEKFLTLSMDCLNLERHDHASVDVRLERLDLIKETGRWSPESWTKRDKLQKKKNVVDTLAGWRREVCLGQGVLILMMRAGEARRYGGPPPDMDAVKYMNVLKERLPKRMDESLKLYIDVQAEDPDSRWHWRSWEHTPTGEDAEAKCMKFRDFFNDFLGLVLLHSANLDGQPKALSEEYFDKGIAESLGFNIGERLEENTKQAAELKLIDEKGSKETKEKLRRYLNEYRHDSCKKWQKRLVETPLDKEMIEAFHKDFEESFSDTAFMRRLVSLKIKDGPSMGEDTATSLGFYHFHEREHFIKDSKPLMSSEFGSGYGSGVANGENIFVFENILKEVPPSEFESLKSSWERAVESNLSQEDAFILTSYGIHILKSLDGDNSQIKLSFEYEQDILKRYPVEPDGFFIYGKKEVPIYEIFSKNDEYKNCVVIASKNSVVLEQMSDKPSDGSSVTDSGVVFKVEDPLSDASLRKKIISEDQDWVKDLSPEEKIEMAPLRFTIFLMEKIRVVIPENCGLVTFKNSSKKMDDTLP